MAYQYRLNDLDINSDIELPELYCSHQASGTNSIHIATGKTPARLDNAHYSNPIYSIDQSTILLTIENCARYLIHNGRKIIIEPFRQADSNSVRNFLLGPALSLLFHQRKLLTVNASAMIIDGMGVLFIGNSGTGKSTMAASLQQQGFLPMGDTLVTLNTGADGSILVHSGLPHLKLWSDSLNALQLDQQQLAPVRTELNKFIYPLKEITAMPVPLARIYQLTEDRLDLDAMRFERANPLESMTLFSHNISHSGLMPHMGLTQQRFQYASAVIKKTPVFRFFRPWNLEQLKPTVDALLQHMTSQPEQP